MTEQAADNILGIFYMVMLFISNLWLTICLDRLFYGLLKERQRKSCGRTERNLLTLLVPAVYLGVCLFLKYIPYVIDALLAKTIMVAAAILVSYVAYPGNTVMKSFIGVSFIAVDYLEGNISVFLHRSLFLLPETIVMRLYEADVPEYWKYCVMMYIPTELLCEAAELIILWFTVNILLKTFKYRKMKFNIQEALFLMIPCITGLLNGLFMHRIPLLFEAATGKVFMEEYPGYTILTVVNAVILLASIIITVILFQSMEERKREELNHITLQNQIEDISAHIREVEQLYAGIRGLKHDIRNHIFDLEALIEQGQYEEARKYGGQLELTMEQMELRYKTGNPVTDVIINEKAAFAQKSGIRFDTEFTFPLDTVINAFDLSVILNNALANAIEACIPLTKENNDVFPYIHILSSRKKDAYLLQVENTFSGSLTMDEMGLPLTTKKEKQQHGMGINNIRMVAEKYYGAIDVEIKEEKEKSFVLTVLLMCS